MAGLIGEGVSLRGFYDEQWAWTWNISGVVNKATDMHKLMAQDATAKNTAKLAGADAAPLGVLGSYEDRSVEGVKVGTVYQKGSFQIPTTGTIAIGDSVVGSATAGVAKAAAAPNRTLVVEVDATNNTAVVIFY